MSNKEQEEIDKLVNMIEDPDQPLKSNTKICNFKTCKEKAGITAIPCTECCLKFCSKHRLPESHSEHCANSKKLKVQQQAKSDARLLSSMNAKSSQGSVNARLEQERKDLKKKLRDKIKNARK
jgi:predicted nucleic acid binding AN1-type Zn finger protein